MKWINCCDADENKSSENISINRLVSQCKKRFNFNMHHATTPQLVLELERHFHRINLKLKSSKLNPSQSSGDRTVSTIKTPSARDLIERD